MLVIATIDAEDRLTCALDCLERHILVCPFDAELAFRVGAALNVDVFVNEGLC